MAHKKKHRGSIPPDNQPQKGPGQSAEQSSKENRNTPPEKAPHEQDTKRRIGDFTGTAEHSFQQPGGKNDANH